MDQSDPTIFHFFHSFVHAAANGVRAEYMRSEYPTKTFPNHFSIVTVSM